VRVPDFRIRNRAELVDALSVAAQVEHIVVMEYLYAAFSCRHTQDPTRSPAVQLASWTAARELYAIAHQEMDHLGAVQQLLAALGAPPVPDAWPFPVGDAPTSTISLPFPAELTRLDLAAVDRFIRTEAPVVPAVPALLAAAPDPIRFDVLGDLYRAIVAGLEELGDAVFLGTPVVGTDPSPLGFAPLRVATAADAVRSITRVIREGEGSSGADPAGHWQRFTAMRDQLAALGPAVDEVAWPCVANPVLQEVEQPGTTLVTHPVTAAVGDIANRAYRALWLLLGGTYVHDWSARDLAGTVAARRDLKSRSMFGARWVMAAVLRPLGEVLARLPAFAEEEGPTAGMCFQQYGEFRVPAQPDARLAATTAELGAIADDLDALAGDPALAAPWAGPRLAALAPDVRMIRDRIGATLTRTRGVPFEPAAPASSWLAVDFEGWYQARLATGGDPYNDPRGVSGWQFAYPGEPDLDRVIRFRPDGTHLRAHVDPGIRVGVVVTAASLDGADLPALRGAPVDLLDGPVFEGRNGVLAFDGDEPIVPLRLRIAGGGLDLERSALDGYRPPFAATASLGAVFPDSRAAAELRERHGLPAQPTVLGPDGRSRPTQPTLDRLAGAHQRLAAARDALPADDHVGRSVLDLRIAQSDAIWWSYGSVVIWRLRLTGATPTAITPDGVPAPTADRPWWLELLSTGFDQDAACALVRGVLHAPVASGGSGGSDGPPGWRMPLAEPAPPVEPVAPMPVDAMGVRPGR
jgi:hypothetical protein